MPLATVVNNLCSRTPYYTTFLVCVCVCAATPPQRQLFDQFRPIALVPAGRSRSLVAICEPSRRGGGGSDRHRPAAQ